MYSDNSANQSFRGQWSCDLKYRNFTNQQKRLRILGNIADNYYIIIKIVEITQLLEQPQERYFKYILTG